MCIYDTGVHIRGEEADGFSKAVGGVSGRAEIDDDGVLILELRSMVGIGGKPRAPQNK